MDRGELGEKGGRMKRLICMAALAGGVVFGQGGKRIEAGGAMLGKVVYEDGKPVAGAVVSLYRKPASDILVVPGVVKGARTAADGTFSLTNVGPGTYRLCPQLPFSEYLNPCEWDATAKNEVVVRGVSSII
jgi:hypothetical protein